MNSFAHNYFLLDLNWDMSCSGCWGTNKEWLCITVCITCEVCCCWWVVLLLCWAQWHVWHCPGLYIQHWLDWNHFKGNVGETSERWGGAHMGFSEHNATILNWTGLVEQLTCCHGCIGHCVLDCGPQWYVDCQDRWHCWRWLRVGYCVYDWRHQLCAQALFNWGQDPVGNVVGDCFQHRWDEYVLWCKILTWQLHSCNSV